MLHTAYAYFGAMGIVLLLPAELFGVVGVAPDEDGVPEVESRLALDVELTRMALAASFSFVPLGVVGADGICCVGTSPEMAKYCRREEGEK